MKRLGVIVVLFALMGSTQAAGLFGGRSIATLNELERTGEGGADWMACNCARQYLQNRMLPGSPCEQYMRIHGQAAIPNLGVGAAMAPASPAGAGQVVPHMNQ